MSMKVLAYLLVICVQLVLSEPPIPAPQYGVPYNGIGPGGPGIPGQPIGPGGPGAQIPPQIPGPGGVSGPNYYNGNELGGGHGDHDHSPGMAYEFGYQVKDDSSGNNYGRQEKSDGNQVTGEYTVALPDGRLQVVRYYADWQTGFHADVRYEGQARYPDQYNINGVNGGNVPNNQYGPPQPPPSSGGINPRNFPEPAPGGRYGPPAGQGNFNPAPGNFPQPAPGGRYGPPAGQGNFNPAPGVNRYDARNYDRGYNYNNGGGGAGNGYVGVNDGIDFDGSYNTGYSRNKPTPVYGPP